MISQFFMLTYAVMNFCVFWVEIGNKRLDGVWSPSFRFYNKWLSLFGAMACFASMFVMNYFYAGPAILVTVILYLWIEYKDPSTQYVPIKRFYFAEALIDCFISVCCPSQCCKRRMRTLTRRKTVMMRFETQDDIEIDDETNTEMMDTMK